MRANIPHSPLFYGSFEPETAFYEIEPEEGDEYFISLWEINIDRSLNWTAYLPEELPIENKWRPLNKRLIKLYRHGLNNHDDYEKFIFLRNQISKWFEIDSKPYRLTSWIGHLNLYTLNSTDFIAYPSKKFSNGRTCIAIHPNSVDQFMNIHTVWYFKVLKGRFEARMVGFPTSTNIQWCEPTDENLLGLSSLILPK